MATNHEQQVVWTHKSSLYRSIPICPPPHFNATSYTRFDAFDIFSITTALFDELNLIYEARPSSMKTNKDITMIVKASIYIAEIRNGISKIEHIPTVKFQLDRSNIAHVSMLIYNILQYKLYAIVHNASHDVVFLPIRSLNLIAICKPVMTVIKTEPQTFLELFSDEDFDSHFVTKVTVREQQQQLAKNKNNITKYPTLYVAPSDFRFLPSLPTIVPNQHRTNTTHCKTTSPKLQQHRQKNTITTTTTTTTTTTSTTTTTTTTTSTTIAQWLSWMLT